MTDLLSELHLLSEPGFSGAAVARFWSKVDATDLFGCWLWTASKNAKGYGWFGVGGRSRKAHRVAYALAVGPIPDGLDIDHTCHTPACVNPAHLRLATTKQNAENRAGADRDSLTGVRGVRRTRRGRFGVRVRHNGREHWGGTYATLAEAEAAVIALRNRLFARNDTDRRAA